MIRDPYARQIWQQTTAAFASAAVSALVAAGSTALITDSDVSGAPTVAAVVALWALELIWSGSYIRAAARRVRELREQQALCRRRHMHRRSRVPVELGPGVDVRAEARDRRRIEDELTAARASAAAEQPPPVLREQPTVPLPLLDDTAPIPVVRVDEQPWPWSTSVAGPVGGVR